MENDSLKNTIKNQKKIIYSLFAFILFIISIFYYQFNELDKNIKAIEKSVEVNKENIDSNSNNLVILNIGTQRVFDEKLDTHLLCIQELTGYLYDLYTHIKIIEPGNSLFSSKDYRLLVDSFFPSQEFYYSECFENLRNQ